MKTLCVKGKVFSGRGEGAEFIKLPWVRKQIKEKLGFIPHPGTLNIKLAEDSIRLKKSLKEAESIEISPAMGFCRGRCCKAYLVDNLECAIVVPEVKNYPEDIIEIIASINLRKKLQLEDGNIVEVKILLK